MSGDLLEDLMSSEGEFVNGSKRQYNERVWKNVNWLYLICVTKRLFWLVASFYTSRTSHLFLCLFRLQCSRLSSVCPLHPVTTTTYTTWTRQKACVTFLMSPFSTSDPWDCCQGGKKNANLPSFSPRFCSIHWRWEEVQQSQYDLMSVQGHLCTDSVSSVRQ